MDIKEHLLDGGNKNDGLNKYRVVIFVIRLSDIKSWR